MKRNDLHITNLITNQAYKHISLRRNEYIVLYNNTENWSS